MASSWLFQFDLAKLLATPVAVVLAHGVAVLCYSCSETVLSIVCNCACLSQTCRDLKVWRLESPSGSIEAWDLRRWFYRGGPDTSAKSLGHAIRWAEQALDSDFAGLMFCEGSFMLYGSEQIVKNMDFNV